MFTGGWGGGERGESINFIRNNNQSKFSLKGIKPKRHKRAHHSLNVHYNVKRSLTKAETKKGRGGRVGRGELLSLR